MLKLKFKNQLWLGNGTVLLLMILIATIVHSSINSLIATSEWVTLTHEEIEQAEIMQKTIRDMQTGMRGFLISGKDNFLTPYYEGQQKFKEILEQTKAMVVDDKELINLLEEVYLDTQKWYEEFAEPAIALRKEANKATKDVHYFEKALGRGRGKRVEIIAILDEIYAKVPLEHKLRTELHMLAVKNSILELETKKRGFLLTGQEAFLERFYQHRKHFQNHMTNLEEYLAKNSMDIESIHNAEKVAMQWIEGIATPLIEARKEINQNTATLKDVAAFVETGKGKKIIDEILGQLIAFNQREETLLIEREEKAKSTANETLLITTLGTALAFCIGIIVIVLLMRNIMRVVNKIIESSFTVNKAANEISQGNINLSQRTEQQASSLEETAASIEQMTGTVQQNTDNTQQAAQLATQARKIAQEGGEVVDSAIIAMVETNKSSERVADIITVIDEIAFQTNLLALNAAVEAARAGEQGRGFAVVATEVRSLAQRSAGAAKEIKKLIQDSVARVQEGTELVNQSGKTLGEIVNAVKKVSDIIVEIAAASQEQTSGIKQINDAIMQLDQITQQNGVLVENAATASNALRDQAKKLEEYITFFGTVQKATELTPTPPVPTHQISKQEKPTINSDWQDF